MQRCVRVSLRLVPVLAGLLALQTAQAFSFGITGYSGNPATGGAYCGACHGSGNTPQVTILGPTVVQPGSTHTYVLRIRDGQETAGGLDVSASAGMLAVSDPGTYLDGGGKITHAAPRAALPGGDVVFTFNWTAPLTSGSATLYAAGNSVNLNGSPSGDAAARTRHLIRVTPDARTPVPTWGVPGAARPPLWTGLSRP